MIAINYEEVLDQLKHAGLIVQTLTFGKLTRCDAEGHKKKAGWYSLREIRLKNGDSVIVGHAGINKGDDHGTFEIQFTPSKKLEKDDRNVIRQAQAEAVKYQQALLLKQHDDNAKVAQVLWYYASPNGHCDYSDLKNYTPRGVKFIPKNGVDLYRLSIRKEGVEVDFKPPPPCTMLIPRYDTSGKIWSIQYIYDSKTGAEHIKIFQSNKANMGGCKTTGTFHMIGPIAPFGGTILVVEGAADAGKLYELTGLTSVTTFSAGNIKPVIAELLDYYKNLNFLIIADNDELTSCSHCNERIILSKIDDQNCPHCHQPHLKKNTGLISALAACFLDNNRVKMVVTAFTAKDTVYNTYLATGKKYTDVSDLVALEGDMAGRILVEHALYSLGWQAGTAKFEKIADLSPETNENLAPISSGFEALERGIEVYPTNMVFDTKYGLLADRKIFLNLCRNREIKRQWEEAENRQIVLSDQVGFFPCNDWKKFRCNLFRGIKSLPKEGDCTLIVELLEFLCGYRAEDYEFIEKWMAYQVQNIGAKMVTAIVMIGGTRSGKSLFWSILRDILSPYSKQLDQRALTSNFNATFSKTLLVVFEEIENSDFKEQANQEGLLKHLIAGTDMLINPKYQAEQIEKNHLNAVFISNNRVPINPDVDDERYHYVMCPDRREADFYKAVVTQIQNGGIAAYHHRLLTRDLTGFDAHTKPPLSANKQRFISETKKPHLQFFDRWVSGELGHIKAIPIRNTTFYELYRFWCKKMGVKEISNLNFIPDIKRIKGVIEIRCEIRPTQSDNKRCKPPFIIPPNIDSDYHQHIGEPRWQYYARMVKQMDADIDDYKNGNYD